MGLWRSLSLKTFHLVSLLLQIKARYLKSQTRLLYRALPS